MGWEIAAWTDSRAPNTIPYCSNRKWFHSTVANPETRIADRPFHSRPSNYGQPSFARNIFRCFADVDAPQLFAALCVMAFTRQGKCLYAREHDPYVEGEQAVAGIAGEGTQPSPIHLAPPARGPDHQCAWYMKRQPHSHPVSAGCGTMGNAHVIYHHHGGRLVARS